MQPRASKVFAPPRRAASRRLPPQRPEVPPAAKAKAGQAEVRHGESVLGRIRSQWPLVRVEDADYQPRTFAKISGTTMVASDSIMYFGVLTFSFPHVIFSLGTAPEYDPKLVVESLIWQK